MPTSRSTRRSGARSSGTVIRRIARTTRIRSILTGLVVVALVAACVVRLVDIQLVRAEALGVEADGRRGAEVPIHGTRGDIVDANGTVLAGTVARWDLTISPRFLHDLTPEGDGVDELVTGGEVLERLAAITGDDPRTYEAAINAELLATDDTSDYLVLATGLDVDQYQQMRDLQTELPIGFVTMRSNPQRIYPAGSVAGNLVGFMGTDEPLAGLEMTQQECLAATDGRLVFERATDGTPIPGSTTVDDPASDGGTLQLTIDADVQFQAQQIAEQYRQQYGAQHANIIVQRVDGSLLAVAESPTVDPNDPGASSPEHLQSWSFTHAFEPGSIFKTLAMAAMLDLGLVETDDELTVPWRYDPAGPVRVQDAHSHPDMQWTTTGAYVQSSNVGMVQMAMGMDRGDLFDYFSDFGLGETSAVDFPGEQDVPLASDPTALDAQTQLNVLFGQGIQMTPIQIVGAYQAIANGGVHEDARLVDSCTLADGTVVEPEASPGTQAVSPETADTLLRMMEHVVTDYGNVEFPIPGYRVAAKTGTAEVVLDPALGYDATQRIVTTAGIFPADDPQFVVYVQLDLPQTERTSAAAIPAFHDMVSVLIREYDIPPSSTQEPDLPLEWTD